MRGIAILLFVVLFVWLVWPYITRWLKRKAIERAEDYMRASMGMPPRDKKRNGRAREENRRGEYYQREERYRHAGDGKEPLIPKEYAEDVEFVETKDYSDTDVRTEGKETRKTYHESQISDAEFVEIKKSSTK